jgi:Domain of unknown function (DUF4919)
MRSYGRYGAIALLAVVSSTFSVCNENTEQEARATYQNLVQQFINGGANNVNLRAMRAAAAEGRVEDEVVARGALAKIDEALKAKEFQQALNLAMQAISQNFTNMEAHFDASLAYKGMGKVEFSHVEELVFRNLVASITDSGDGNSAKTAYFVVYQREEYIVCRVFGLHPTAQGLRTKDGHHYDVLTVTDKQNKIRDLWFNADTILRLESTK